MGVNRRDRRRQGEYAENCKLSPLTGSLVSTPHLRGHRSRQGPDAKHSAYLGGAWGEEWTWRRHWREDRSKTENWNRPLRGILDLDARMRRRRFEGEENDLRGKVKGPISNRELRPIGGDDTDGASEVYRDSTATRDDEGGSSHVANNHVEEFTI